MALTGGNGTVLLMDDEELVREVGSEILMHIGYDVHLAADGGEAIEMYERAVRSGTPYIAVIMDITVRGGMGGREAIEKLKEIDPDVRAIVSSGYCNDPVMSDYDKYGFSGVVVKPYRVEEMRMALCRCLNI